MFNHPVTGRPTMFYALGTLSGRYTRNGRDLSKEETDTIIAAIDGKKIKVCSEPSCSNPAKKKCNACKVARYCCAACQKQHWRLEPHGHKTECDVLAALKKKEAFWFTASDGAGAEQGGGGGGGGSASASGGGGPACASGGGGSSGGGSSSDGGVCVCVGWGVGGGVTGQICIGKSHDVLGDRS